MYDPPPGVTISTLEYEYGAAWEVPLHAHGSDQLIYAVRGVMEVTAGDTLWVIPPQFALWVPAGIQHRIRMARPVSMRTLYLRAGRVRRAKKCAVLHVSPLLRELTLEAVRLGKLRARVRGERALSDVIASQLEKATPVPTSVRLPKEPRTAAVCQAVLREPGSNATLSHLCRAAFVSVRTVQRMFRAEIGIEFDAWRRQVRLMGAIALLSQGRSVKEAAYAMGYRQPGGFIAAFRKTFAESPRAWIRARGMQ
jgi:AraC-like DNA-binding protein